MKTYTVRARRVGSWWALDVEGVRGVRTQVKRLDQAEGMVRDALSGVLDRPPGSFAVEVVPEAPRAVRDAVAKAARARSHAALAQEDALQLTREAVRRMVDEGLTVRDAGRLLGISHQRVTQLLQAGR